MCPTTAEFPIPHSVLGLSTREPRPVSSYHFYLPIMTDMFGLPMTTGPTDLLRNGFRNTEHEMNAPHPIQGLDKRTATAELNSRIERVRRVYGTHMAMRLATEEVTFGKARRLPGLPSSTALYDTITGSGTCVHVYVYVHEYVSLSCISLFLSFLQHTLTPLPSI